MATSILGLDIGGANLKAATPDRRAVSVPFALWKHPEQLPAALAALVAQFPDATELAVTMTGELCDCFETKREGVNTIVDAVQQVAGTRAMRVWSTDGKFLQGWEGKVDQNYMKVAAANWHALATFAGRYVPSEGAVLIDVGSTTSDIIPILDGKPVPEGKTDYDRIFTNELLYTGVRRTPICSLFGWQVAAEVFATTLDAYLLLGLIPEDRDDCDTADERPATKHRARARLCRMYCGDIDTIPTENIQTLAESVRDRQQMQLSHCIEQATNRLRLLKKDVGIRFIVSGSGDFLARLAVRDDLCTESLSRRLGPAVSACAPAYAVAVLAAERRP
ncbi:MAG: H4MPT-linked C1 transfer pathway protein [Planctomycetes bacterium]|nr:H4MPT-linked C1 transfer pathway protein [Planctomycetota bacterium]